MPQASERLRAKMRDMFESLYGHYGLDELSPISFLKDRGYELTTEFTWHKEGVEELWEMQPDELACLQFLVEEFDYGGLHDGPLPEVDEEAHLEIISDEMSETELMTADEALMKYKAPWYYDDAMGDILDAGGHYVMSCYDLGIAEIILRGANDSPPNQNQIPNINERGRE